MEIKYPSIDLKSLLGRPLNDIEGKYAPEVIYYKGPMEIPLPCARVSIIGSRNASENGLLEAEEITKILIKNRAIIVSGLAKGIDT
ncbi:MAG: DNA-processing protein DprA, partial [Nitrosotalea sp.]